MNQGDPTQRSSLYCPDSKTSIEFDASLTIGRHPANDLVIDHSRVSARHAAVEWDGERWRIRDLGSSNGTTVGGKRCKGWTPLREGVLLRFAGVSRWRVERILPPPDSATFGQTGTPAG